MLAVGVMYTAKADATPEQLDARLPLSVAVWHRHVHLRLAERRAAQRLGRPGGALRLRRLDRRRSACAAAGGYWIPRVFGWMTHVYPLESDADRIWLGEHMMETRGATRSIRPEHAHHHR